MDSGTFSISVSKPCKEDWDAMIPNQHGRYCTSCDKTVIDFSNMTDEELQLFFIQNRHKQICGRFRQAQIERITIYLPATTVSGRLYAWQKYLIALLICFGSSLFSVDVVIGSNPGLYAQTVQADHQQANKTSQKAKKKKKQKVKGKTIKLENFVLGFTQTFPVYKQPLISSFLNPLHQPKKLSTKDSIAEVNKEKKPEKKDNPERRKQRMEFMLPQSAVIRRRQSK